MSIHVAESINQQQLIAGHFSHVGRLQLRTKLSCNQLLLIDWLSYVSICSSRSTRQQSNSLVTRLVGVPVEVEVPHLAVAMLKYAPQQHRLVCRQASTELVPCPSHEATLSTELVPCPSHETALSTELVPCLSHETALSTELVPCPSHETALSFSFSCVYVLT